MAAAGRPLKLAAIALLLVLAAGAALWAYQREARPEVQGPLGLMSSLPIYWPDGADLQVALDADTPLPWVRSSLEQRYRIVPLDTLAPGAGAAASADPLAGIERLLIAQPRGLSPADNVALDQWVRDGGRLLFVLDPMLAGQYAVPLGDPRHPVSVGLIPPVLIRWGLDMRYSENQPFAPREVDYGAGTVPVLLGGELVMAEADPSASAEDRAARGDCRILENAIVAQCKVGKGRVTVLADAALLELPDPLDASEDQLAALTELAFD
ncbi:MAG: Gldg family protein [Erythrobacter sp.]